MLDIQRAHDAILRAITAYEKAKEKAMMEWSMPVAEDMLLLMMAGIKQDAMKMIGGNYGKVTGMEGRRDGEEAETGDYS